MELIEAQIENIVITKLRTALSDYDNVSVVGTWQPTTGNDVKGLEDKPVAVIGVKAFPRSYETPTVPSAEIQIEVSMAVRSDVDFNGTNYLGLTEKISDVFQDWQNDFGNLTDFNIEGKFDVTGFNLTGGDCGLDRDNSLWQYVQGLTVYGIVAKPTHD